MKDTNKRSYPVIDEPPRPDPEPISFVVVRFSDEYDHNILQSPCVKAPRNQLICVDNRWGHRFDTLGAAINDGLARARHDLVAVVHEDVVLVRRWQARFDRVLRQLQAQDPDWGLAGSVGWDRDSRVLGHWSDPHHYKNTLAGRPFAEVARLDEQILIFRKSSGLRFDDMLPSIHNIGRDLAATLAQAGRRIYALDAPTIHKYADGDGARIESADESSKIQTRFLPANLAEWVCSNAYLHRKWPSWTLWPDPVEDSLDPAGDTRQLAGFAPPVILLARGGSGSRLMSRLMQDLGYDLGRGLRRTERNGRPVFTPMELRPSGDADFMREAVYRGVLATYQRRAEWQRAQVVPRLRAHAARMLQDVPPGTPWGFKLPETLMLLPQIDQAFPGARYVHQIRDPLTTCLRRSHMTARFDNAIGRTAIRAAYAHCDRDIAHSLTDGDALRMAYTTRHQIETARAYAAARLAGRYLEIGFEEILADPGATRARVADWLGATPVSALLDTEIDPGRAQSGSDPYPEPIAGQVAAVLADLRRSLGYPKRDPKSGNRFSE